MTGGCRVVWCELTAHGTATDQCYVCRALVSMEAPHYVAESNNNSRLLCRDCALQAALSGQLP